MSVNADFKLSVVIPSIARDSALLNTLAELARQDFRAFECVVVLQGEISGDLLDSLRQVQGLALRIFHAREPSASLARNIGLKEARGEIVLFLDDDVLLPNADFLTRHVAYYEEAKIHAVAGQILALDGKVRDQTHWMASHPRCGWLFFPSNYNRDRLALNGASANLSVRKKSALAVGGMDAHFEKGAHREESDFCLRLCAKFGPLMFSAGASLLHIGEPSGGCRTWGDFSGVYPLHHVAGEWYFIRKGLRFGFIKWFDAPFHLYCLLRRQILNPVNGWSFQKILIACKASLEGWRSAGRKLAEGPRYCALLRDADYSVVDAGSSRAQDVTSP